MKDMIKTATYSMVGVGLLGLNQVSALSATDTKPNTTGDNITDGDFIGTIDLMLGYIIGLLYFIAVVLALYGGFQILTAGGEEEKVKKGKTTLINAVIGLVIIFLASQIVSWIIGIMTADTGGAVT